jgi:DNA invertase Pin-like site-specific DNA recombinase
MRHRDGFIDEANGIRMGKLIGYARVSTGEQDVQLQLDALKQAGCEEEYVFIDKASGARPDRPGLDACLAVLEPGDTLVVWRLDRLGRSMSHLVTMVEELLRKQIGFRSLCDGAIDTTTASGELMFNIFSALAQFERRLIQERTQAGLSAARARGRKGGRKPISADEPRVKTAKLMHKNRDISINQICETLKISRPTFYRYLAISNNQTP